MARSLNGLTMKGKPMLFSKVKRRLSKSEIFENVERWNMYYDLNYLKGQTMAGTKKKQLGLAFLRFFFFYWNFPSEKCQASAWINEKRIRSSVKGLSERERCECAYNIFLDDRASGLKINSCFIRRIFIFVKRIFYFRVSRNIANTTKKILFSENLEG